MSTEILSFAGWYFLPNVHIFNSVTILPTTLLTPMHSW